MRYVYYICICDCVENFIQNAFKNDTSIANIFVK